MDVWRYGGAVKDLKMTWPRGNIIGKEEERFKLLLEIRRVK